jgi:hypothetical protein
MPFSSAERTALKAQKYVGDTVIDRLEQLGFSSLEQLKTEVAPDLTLAISKLIGSTCWHNSPQAKAAIENAIALANA